MIIAFARAHFGQGPSNDDQITIKSPPNDDQLYKGGKRIFVRLLHIGQHIQKFFNQELAYGSKINIERLQPSLFFLTSMICLQEDH